MSQQPRPNWMDEEDKRSEELVTSGETVNENAPRLVKQRRRATPKRMQKALYIQESHASAFDGLVFKQKLAKGKKAPELAEEAIRLLLKKYGEDYKILE